MRRVLTRQRAAQVCLPVCPAARPPFPVCSRIPSTQRWPCSTARERAAMLSTSTVHQVDPTPHALPPASPLSKSNGSDPQTRKIIRTLLSYVWPKGERDLQIRVVASGILLVGAKLCNIAVPFSFKAVADTLSQVSNTPAIQAQPDAAVVAGISDAAGTGLEVAQVLPDAVGLPMLALIGYGLARTASAGMTEARNTIFSTVAQRAIRLVSLDVFSHLHAMDLRFHLGRQTGALTRIVDRGSKSINFVLTSLVFNAVPTVLEIGLVSSIFAAQCGWEYTAVTLGTMGAYIWFTVAITTWRTAIRKRMITLENETSQLAIDSLLNYETVKYYNGEAHELRKYDAKQKQVDVVSIDTQSSLSLLNFGQNAIFSVGLTACMVMAAKEVMSGTMTVGDLILVNGLLFQLSIPLNFVGMVYREVRQGLMDMGEMFNLLATEPAAKDAPDARTLVVPAGVDTGRGNAIEFRNLRFSYSPDRPILQGISFSVPMGKTVAIVGPSGCGKSTLVRLLFRFYDASNASADEGVFVFGQNVKSVTQSSLRSAIGVVPQDTVLFNDTLENNIAYGKAGTAGSQEYPGRVDIPFETIIDVSKKAHLHEAIQHFPKGYGTQVGERGLKLSGGEKQRVSLARVLLKDAPILLCDEATSSLDTRTEADVMSSLKDVASGRTTLLIAHRLSTVRHADEIVVLDKGRVVEQGNHYELLSKGGMYAKLWAHQREQQKRTNESTAAST